MATEVWAKEVEGTGLTINIVNPGAGANTPGMADEMRAMSREGRAPRLVEPEEMVPPLLYVVSRDADSVNGYRFDANLWDPSLAACRGRPPRRPPGRLRDAPATGLRMRVAVIPRGNQRGAGRHCTVFSRSAQNWGLVIQGRVGAPTLPVN